RALGRYVHTALARQVLTRNRPVTEAIPSPHSITSSAPLSSATPALPFLAGVCFFRSKRSSGPTTRQHNYPLCETLHTASELDVLPILERDVEGTMRKIALLIAATILVLGILEVW